MLSTFMSDLMLKYYPGHLDVQEEEKQSTAPVKVLTSLLHLACFYEGRVLQRTRIACRHDLKFGFAY